MTDFHFFVNKTKIAVAILSCLATPTISQAAWLGFDTPQILSVGAQNEGIEIADLNDDGILDLIGTNLTTDEIFIFIGNDNGSGGWDGTFQAPVNYAVGRAPVGLDLGDFNGDTVPDIVASSFFSPTTLRTLQGNGDGTFQPSVTVNTDGTRDVIANDFTGDGILDLATANTTFDSASLFVGNDDGFGMGDGTFQAPWSGATGSFPGGIVEGYFNNDTHLDLAVADLSDDIISILMGNGDGTFQPAVDYPVGDQPVSITCADFNGDTFADLAVANIDSDDITVLLNNGTGLFSSAVHYPGGSSNYNITSGDISGDGIVDLLVASLNTGMENLTVFIGNGDGTFQTAIEIFNSSARSFDVAVADLNGDGFLDAVTSNGGGTVSVLLNLGPNVELSLSPSSLAFADGELGASGTSLSTTVESTGVNDLVTTATLTNDGGGAFALTALPTSPLSSGNTSPLTVSFNPTTLGPVIGEVSLETNSTSGTVTIALSGTGIDTQEPSSSATSPTGSLTQPSATISVVYTSSDNVGGSGVASVELFYQRDGGGYTSGGVYTSSPISFDTSATGGDGSYDFYTVATDNAGNVESKTASAEISVVFNDNTTTNEWQEIDD